MGSFLFAVGVAAGLLVGIIAGIALAWFYSRSRSPSDTVLLEELRTIMASMEERLAALQTKLNDGMATLGAALTNVAADIDRLKAAVLAGQPTEATVAGLEATGDQVAAMAQTVSDLAASTPDA